MFLLPSQHQLLRLRLVWLYGVLGWGVTTGTLWAVYMSAVTGWGGLPVNLAIALVLFPIGGYVWGRMMWRQLRK